MKPAHPGLKLTYDDFVLFPDDGKRHELIDGEHYVTPSPNTRHQTILGTLYFLIRVHLEMHPIGRVLVAPFDVVFSDVDVVEPDVLYVSNTRAADVLTPKHVRGTPELVIEIGARGGRPARNSAPARPRAAARAYLSGVAATDTRARRAARP